MAKKAKQSEPAVNSEVSEFRGPRENRAIRELLSATITRKRPPEAQVKAARKLIAAWGNSKDETLRAVAVAIEYAVADLPPVLPAKRGQRGGLKERDLWHFDYMAELQAADPLLKDEVAAQRAVDREKRPHGAANRAHKLAVKYRTSSVALLARRMVKHGVQTEHFPESSAIADLRRPGLRALYMAQEISSLIKHLQRIHDDKMKEHDELDAKANELERIAWENYQRAANSSKRANK